MNSEAIVYWALLIGYMLIGTVVLFYAHRGIAALLRSRSDRKNLPPDESLPITPHNLIVVLVLVSVVFTFPFQVRFVSFPEGEVSLARLLLWALAIVVIIASEVVKARFPGYRESWWCKPIGSKDLKSGSSQRVDEE